jgi:hypothetical protein
MVLLLAFIISLAIPIEVLAYKESMSELVIGGCPGVIVQNQSYSTSTKQNLFHSATNAITDTEGFAFGDTPQTGIKLGQTSSLTGTGTETGFYSSSASSDIVPPVHIGNGFLGTWIDDPLLTGTPIFAGMTFPQMMKTDTSALASQPIGLSTSGDATARKTDTTGNRTSAVQAAGEQPAGNVALATDNQTSDGMQIDTVTFRPVIDNALDETLANQSARNATATTSANATKSAAGKPSPTPSPAIKPGQVFYHQQNKPFSADITAPSGPFKATTASTRNTTGFDRFLRNTVGRSTTDKAFNGTTSSPTYISPGEALAEQIPYDFIQGARGMTMPGTHLNYRAWPL